MEGIVFCDRGTCLVPSETTRRLNQERYAVLTIPLFTINKKEQTEELGMADLKIREPTIKQNIA